MRFLIAGLGSIGRRHLKNLVSLGQKDIILLRSQVNYPPEDDLKDYPAFTNTQTALQNKPDAVIVSNPTALHLQVAIPFARAGCHLLLEKPISNNMQDVEKLEEAVSIGKGKVLVGFQFRFHPGLLKIKELISTNTIGSVFYIRSQWGEYLPSWHPAEDYRKGYSARKELGGGVVLSLCHPLDYLHWIFGDVVELFAETRKSSDLELDVEDTAEVMMHFSSGALASLHLDYVQQPPSHTLEVTGSDGFIKWDNSGGAVHLYRNKEKEWQVFPIKEGFSRNDLFLAEMRHFVKCIQGEEQPACNLEEGIYSQKMIEAIYCSSAAHSYKNLSGNAI